MMCQNNDLTQQDLAISHYKAYLSHKIIEL